MAGPIYQLDAPGLAKLVGQLAALLRQDPELRAIQAANAPACRYFDQPGVFTRVGSVSVTGTVVYQIQEAQNQQAETFAQLVLVFESTSGSGRYRIDGGQPSATVGTQIPAGGVVLTIPGQANIRNFKMMAEAAQTLVFSRMLFI
jgi:hypothetical protein